MGAIEVNGVKTKPWCNNKVCVECLSQNCNGCTIKSEWVNNAISFIDGNAYAQSILKKPPIYVDEKQTEYEVTVSMNPLHKEFYDVIFHMIETFKAKNNDYAGCDAEDMMRNFKACERSGVTMSDGIVTRLTDKISRMENLMRTRSKMVKDESLVDTVIDLANYAIFLSIALKREQKKENMSVETW